MAGQGDTAPLVELAGVAKGYGRPGAPVASAADGDARSATRVLESVDLVVQSGESVAIIGPSGSGKSTLLQLIGALDTPDAGTIRVAGTDLASLDDVGRARLRGRELGFVFQSHHLLPQCTALENALVPTLVHHSAEERREARERARALFERVGLSSRLEHRPGELSGGECQRVALVRALTTRPRLLLADEPTGALDRVASQTMARLLAELNTEEGVTSIVVTHSVDLARGMQRILSLEAGRLVPAQVPSAEPGATST